MRGIHVKGTNTFRTSVRAYELVVYVDEARSSAASETYFIYLFLLGVEQKLERAERRDFLRRLGGHRVSLPPEPVVLAHLARTPHADLARQPQPAVAGRSVRREVEARRLDRRPLAGRDGVFGTHDLHRARSARPAGPIRNPRRRRRPARSS